jgi:D-alanyl-D-alanine carboxypeptidase (penicillin-binding protein 5/6)
MACHRLFPFVFALLAGIVSAQPYSDPPTATLGPAPTAPKPAPAPIPSPPTLTAKSYLLEDYTTGQVLAEREADAPVEPASITKVMAAYVLFHELEAGRITLEDRVRVSENAWRQGLGGSRMFLNAGSRVTVKELLLGMIVQSGNDATIALAEHVAGSEESFVALMNQHSARLGMHGSNWTNSPGLPDPQHYTTARDLAKLARAVITEFPQYYAWYSVREYTHNGIRQYNRNTLLTRDETVDGMKTGHTQSAGYCLLSSAKRGDMRLIAVLMGSASERARADQSQALLNWGFRFFEPHRLYAAGQRLHEIELWKGSVDRLALGVESDVHVLVPRGQYDRLEASMELPKRVYAPIDKGQRLGQVRVRLGDRLLAERPLVALEAVEQGSMWKRFGDAAVLWWRGDESSP